MKGKLTGFIQAGGVNSSLQAQPTDANSIINLRWDGDNGCWRADRSFQPWWEYPVGTNYQWNNTLDGSTNFLLENPKSIFFWKKPGTNTIYNFVEKSGALYVVAGNDGAGTGAMSSGTFRNRWYKITDWEEAKDDEPGTQYIPFGNKLFIISTNNKPLWFSHLQDWREFSFTIRTPEPNVIPIQPDYAQGEPLQSGTGRPTFTENQVRGVGLTDGTTNYYGYAIAYGTEDGALSPLSEVSTVSWRVPQTGSNEYKFGVVINLPPCPKGCSARYIYRTKNIKTPKDGDNTSYKLYFLKTIKDASSNFFIDILPDSALISEANSFASILINTDYRFGENWDGRMWLANKQRLIFSERGIPEQFGATSYFDLGNSFGGDITAIKAFRQNLIVFRENSINVIKIDGNGGYAVSILTTSLGTVASNAIVYVPKLGLVFPNEDGIWALQGTMEGGDIISVNKISHRVNEELKTLNASGLRRCIAAYSPLEKEYWLHYPSYYDTIPNQGIVIHTDREELTFSFRKAEPYANNNNWTFTAMAIDGNGRFVFAGAHKWTNDLNLNSMTNLFGWLQVWCASTYQTNGAIITGTGENFQLTFTNIQPQNTSWESTWIEFDRGTVRVFSVELDIAAYGDLGMELSYQVDYSNVRNQTTAQKQTESKVLYTVKEPPVSVGPAGPNGITKNPFVINSSEVQGIRKVRLRFDVNTELCNQFRFRVQGENLNPFTIMGYRLNISQEGTPLLNQAINRQKGQSR